jgi:hypothetical protein
MADGVPGSTEVSSQWRGGIVRIVHAIGVNPIDGSRVGDILLHFHAGVHTGRDQRTWNHTGIADSHPLDTQISVDRNGKVIVGNPGNIVDRATNIN